MGRAVALKNIEDVQVTIREGNKKKIDKRETEYGIFTEGLKFIGLDEKNTTNIRNIGDVTFIVNGKPFATFRRIGNPEDIARIVNTEKENILSYEIQTQRNAVTHDWSAMNPFDIAPLLGHFGCHMCGKNVFPFRFETENLCLECFEQKYGKLLLAAINGEYYGGHKVHLAGGIWGEHESGHMSLTEEFFIFAKWNEDASKRWEIIIPLDSVTIDQWSVKGESRRKQIVGGSTAVTGNVAFGGGTIHEGGQRHRLLIPYVDENGIVQQPVFGVSSYGGKDIRKWAETLYEQLVEEKQQQSSPDVNQNVQTDKDNDPIAVLKLRYAKGEITKEEYEEMRKTIES